jgi:predicted PurR-regulated permease PerM
MSVIIEDTGHKEHVGSLLPSLNEEIIHAAIRLGVLGLILYWSFTLIRPFIPIIIWSILVTVIVYPVFNWLAEKMGRRRRLAAVLTTLLVLLIAVGPVVWLAIGLVDELTSLSRQFETGELVIPLPPESVKQWPLFGAALYDFWLLASDNLKAAFVTVAPQLKPVAGELLKAAQAAGTGLLAFILSLVIAGFLLCPAPAMLNGIKTFSRRLTARGEQFVELAGATVRSVTRGVIGIAILQAALVAIGLVVARIPGAGVITFVSLILAIIQIGPTIIILPTILWSWTAMETSAALIFTLYMIPVCLVDNVLRPLIMGRGLSTPMPVILVGLIGGMLVHGMIGIFVGPVVLAVAWSLVTAWARDAESRLPIGAERGRT